MEPLARLIHQQRRPSLGAPPAVPPLPAEDQTTLAISDHDQI